jgi:hypothetical protein
MRMSVPPAAPAREAPQGGGGPPTELRGLPEAREPRFWRNLLRRLRPRDRRFYPLFDLHAQLCVSGIEALVQLLADLSDPRGRVREIEALEKRADGIVHEVHAAVRRSLFPPHPRSAASC